MCDHFIFTGLVWVLINKNLILIVPLYSATDEDFYSSLAQMAGSDIEDEDEVRDYLTIYPPWPFLGFLDDQFNAIFFILVLISLWTVTVWGRCQKDGWQSCCEYWFNFNILIHCCIHNLTAFSSHLNIVILQEHCWDLWSIF